MPDPVESSPLRQTSRGKVSRIDRTYFLRPNRLQLARRWLVLGCLALGIAWCAWGAFDAPLHHAPGPVAAAHAKWENDCNACHVPFSPIKDDTWLSTAATRQAMDGKCETCHRGPAHHPLQVAAEVGSCASCHADHRGRDADLSRVADRTCTACHADISAHRLVDTAVPAATVTTPITRFDNEHHPAFAGLRSDPGKLKFSHGRHMRAGLTFGPPSTEPGSARALTYGMLAAADRPRYQPASAGAADPVQLSCASCHEFGTSLPSDAVRTLPAALAAAPPGAYALPVEFERHCAACHQLPFEGVAGQPAAAHPADDSAGLVMVKPNAVVPHGLDAVGMARLLESHYLQEALAGDAAPLDEPLVPRPLPAPRPADAAGSKVRSLVETQVNRALAFTRGTCEKCHDTRDAAIADASHVLAAAAADDRARLPWFAVEPTRVPAVWLTKARFDHGPHRAYDCRECHAAAAPDDTGIGGPAATPPVGSPLDNGIVMIAGRESCTACHAPSGHDSFTGRPIGGARFDCVECHGYHGLGPHQSPTAVATAGGAAGSPPGALTHARPE